MDNISGDEPNVSVEAKLASAERYTQVAGWRVFVVRENKSTFANCVNCAEAGADHDFATCGHLICHAQHAGTTDMNKIREMFELYPSALLAVATGRKSGIIALDFEGHTDDPELPTGLEVKDDWESFTNGMVLTPTLEAATRSGGRHLIYNVGPDDAVISRNRVLPNMDVKADGGYIVLPPGPGRFWVHTGLPSEAPNGLIEWLTARDGRKSSAWIGKTSGERVGHADGYNFELFFRDHCPGGYRDEFINDLIFRLRKRNRSFAEAENIVRSAWERVAQPPYAKYYMKWEHVHYKLERVWRTVAPETIDDVEIPETLRTMARNAQQQLKRGEVVVARRAMAQHPGYGKR